MSTETSREMPTQAARLVIADDHALVRDGIRSILSNQPDLEVVGEAANGRDTLELCRSLKPDLILMDVSMPDMDGLEATRAIKREHPSTGVLIVTMHENREYLLEALNAGAAGYILKGTPGVQLIDAVRRAVQGESPLDQDLVVQLLRNLAKERNKEVSPPEPRMHSNLSLELLTAREIEVLSLLAGGRSTMEIAQILSISKATARVHIERIRKKLGVSDRTQAALRAIELGLAEPEPE